MPAPRFRLRTLLTTTTVVAFLLAIGATFSYRQLEPFLQAAIFAIVLLGPQFAFVSWAHPPESKTVTARLLWGFLSCGPGSVLATGACFAIDTWMGYDWYGTYLRLGAVVILLQIVAAILYAGAMIRQTYPHCAAGKRLNAACLCYACVLIYLFLRGV